MHYMQRLIAFRIPSEYDNTGISDMGIVTQLYYIIILFLDPESDNNNDEIDQDVNLRVRGTEWLHFRPRWGI